MAGLLAVTLQNQPDIDAKRKAIEAAMLMVSETAQANAEAQIAKLEATHQQEMARLQMKVHQLSVETTSVNQLQEWLGPIYTNQNRNYQQMKLVSVNNAAINRTLALLEKQIDRGNAAKASQKIHNHTIAKADYVSSEQKDVFDRQLPAYQITKNRTIDYSKPTFQTAEPATEHAPKKDSENEIQRLQAQLNTIQTRLESLQNDKVRPAGHLEPVYTPDKPLKPIYHR